VGCDFRIVRLLVAYLLPQNDQLIVKGRMTSMTLMTPRDLLRFGLSVHEGKTIEGSLVYERPAFVHDPRCIRNCTLGAFTLINGRVTTSLYACDIGRYGQIGESVILGPPEHPQDWFSSHPFAFSRPDHLPNMYRLPEFARLAPEHSDAPSYAESAPYKTTIGHEAYIGAGAFVKRGVRIGDGAVIGAQSVVTRDVPAYAIVVGSPARLIRMRFEDHIIERMQRLQWWRYDLAPIKQQVDFSKVEPTLDFLEQCVAEGTLSELRPQTFRVRRQASGFEMEELAEPLF